MPLFSYNCKYHKDFDHIVSVEARDKVVCPQCGGPVKRSVINKNTSFQLKGSGWTPNFGSK